MNQRKKLTNIVDRATVLSTPRVAPGMTDDEFSTLSPMAQSLLRIESRLTRYVEGPGVGERQCRTCVRKGFGGPSCCNEGWVRMRSSDPGGCANWTDRGDGKVAIRGTLAAEVETREPKP